MRPTFLITILMAPALARAEVLDKEFFLSTVVGVALFGSLAAFWAARKYPWVLAVLLPITGMFYWLHLSEFLDPYVGPEMVREGGVAYVVVSWLSPLPVAVSAAYGLVLKRRSRRRMAQGSKGCEQDE
jgi:hypothetical protein